MSIEKIPNDIIAEIMVKGQDKRNIFGLILSCKKMFTIWKWKACHVIGELIRFYITENSAKVKFDIVFWPKTSVFKLFGYAGPRRYYCAEVTVPKNIDVDEIKEIGAKTGRLAMTGPKQLDETGAFSIDGMDDEYTTKKFEFEYQYKQDRKNGTVLFAYYK